MNDFYFPLRADQSCKPLQLIAKGLSFSDILLKNINSLCYFNADEDEKKNFFFLLYS